MKLGIDFSKQRTQYIEASLKQVLQALMGAEFVAVKDADLVFTATPGDCLRHLKSGKKVIQIILGQDTRATGLLTAPAYKDKFLIQQAFGDPKWIVCLIENINKLMAEEDNNETIANTSS